MPVKSIVFILLGLALSSCTGIATPAKDAVQAGTAPRTSSTSTPPAAATGEVRTLPYAPASSRNPSATVLAMQPQRVVLVAAAKGNLFIRRGPDLGFNAVSVLMDGQSEKALARDVLGKWLQIPIPGHPDKTGWVSIQTRYSRVSGDTLGLPEIAPIDSPVPAFLRNCTEHQMEADPGGIVLPAVDNFPENDVRVNPGVYTIHDVEVDRAPEVMRVEIREGSAVDIRENGDGEHRKCSAP